MKAFPQHYNTAIKEGAGGMDLRDYFAAHAPGLAGIGIKEDRELLAGYKEPERTANIIEQLEFNALVEAKLRYIYADSMIKARDK